MSNLSFVTSGLLEIVSSFATHSECHLVTNCQTDSPEFAQLIFNYWGVFEQTFFTKDKNDVFKEKVCAFL